MSIEKITFFLVSDKEYDLERDAMSPLAKEATRRGYEVEFTKELEKPTDIGVFAQSTSVNSDNMGISAIMPHGIDSYTTEKKWVDSCWSSFDVGFVTGDFFANKWRKDSWDPSARPKKGVFNAGWPKSDAIYSGEFDNQKDELCEELNMDNKPTILYAPGKENDDKMGKFIEELKHLNYNLLIKHAPLDKNAYIFQWENINKMYNKYKNFNNVYVANHKKDIMTCLGVSDILVTDDSSVTFEALLVDTIPVVVTDWPIQAYRNSDKIYRNHSHHAYTLKTEISNLKQNVEDVFSNPESHLKNIKRGKNLYFNNIGNSSEIYIDVLENCFNNSDPVIDPIEPEQNKKLQMYDHFRGNIPPKIKQFGEKMHLDDLIVRIDDFVGYR